MTQREQQILDWITEDPMISQEALAERAGITRSSVAVHISNLMKKGHIVGRGYPARRRLRGGGRRGECGHRGTVRRPAGGAGFQPRQGYGEHGGVGRNIAHNLRLLGSRSPC